MIFIENMASPVISNFSPSLGPVGQWVYIFGSNFIGGDTRVFFDDTEVPSITVYDDGQLGFWLPDTTSVSGKFKVVTSDGEVTSVDSFIVGIPLTSPEIYKLVPHSDPDVNWTYISGDGFVCEETTVSYNSGGSIKAMVYSPDSLGFEKVNITDVITTLSVTTPNGTASYP